MKNFIDYLTMFFIGWIIGWVIGLYISRSIIMKDYRQLLSILQEQNKQFRKQIHLNLDYFMVKNNVYYTDLNELDMLLGFPI